MFARRHRIALHHERMTLGQQVLARHRRAMHFLAVEANRNVHIRVALARRLHVIRQGLNHRRRVASRFPVSAVAPIVDEILHQTGSEITLRLRRHQQL